jgi:hypothetical protein
MKSTIFVLSILCVMLTLTTFYMFSEALRLGLGLQRTAGELKVLAEIHKSHIEQHRCETWEGYIGEIKRYDKYSKLDIYIKCCEAISAKERFTKEPNYANRTRSTKDNPIKPAGSR